VIDVVFKTPLKTRLGVFIYKNFTTAWIAGPDD